MLKRTMRSSAHTILRLLAVALLACAFGAMDAPAEPAQTATGRAEAREADPPAAPTLDPAQAAATSEPPLAVTHPELFEPLPLPTPRPEDEGAPPVPAGKFVSKDLVMGRITQEPEAAYPGIPGPNPGGLGVYGTTPDDPAAKNFDLLTRVTDTTTGRYPTAVKLYMTFQDAGGTNHYFVGSGTLIDPKHVITAGHCVYDHSNYTAGYGWATAITVVPAYDDPAWPFGGARAVSLHSWTAWTTNGLLDHDLGVINLDRPVGALSGWRGFGYDNAFDFFTTPTWTHNGYPAATPYDGLRMYTQSGDFDGGDYASGAWTGNEVFFNRQSYGGQSGSGAVKNDAVYAVLSNGNSTLTNDVRIPSDKFIQIQQLIGAHTADTPDLVPLECRAPVMPVAAGNHLGFLDFLVHNSSSASVDDTYGFDVYLSTDDDITTADTRLGSYTFTYALGPLQNVRVSFGIAPQIPASTTTGIYYVGVILTYPDADLTNNDTDGWDAAEIFVICPAPPAPTLLFPPDGLEYADPEGLLEWASVEGAVEYEVQLGTTCGAGGSVFTTVPEVPYDGLEPWVTYSWRVRCHNACGAVSAWSDCFSFTTYIIQPPPRVEVSTAAPGPVTVRVAPDGSGPALDHAQLWDGVPGHSPAYVDATTTIVITVGDTPVQGYPAEDIWLETTMGGLAPCIGGTMASGPTDVNGTTTIVGPFFAGGYSNHAAGEQAVVVIAGDPIGDQPLDIFFNSGDLDGSGFANLTDAGMFANDLFNPYNHRSDFLWDGVINLSDVGMMANMLGASCPRSAAKAAGAVAAGHLGLHLDPRGATSAATLAAGTEITAYLLLSGAVSREGIGAWECGLELPENVQLMSCELAAPALNLSGPPDFVVGAGRPLFAEPGRPLQLAALRLLALDEKPATVRLRASNLASLGSGAAVVAIGTELELRALPLAPGDAQGTTIWINDPDAPVWAAGPAVAAALDLRAAPNPFNPQTEIRFNLARPGEVAIRIYDVGGRLVRELEPGRLAAGSRGVVWDGRDTGGATSASGVYFGRLLLDGQVTGPTLKMSVVK